MITILSMPDAVERRAGKRYRTGVGFEFRLNLLGFFSPQTGQRL